MLKRRYNIFIDDLLHSATTRACVFATCHKEATLWLMKKMEEAGLAGYVGKVNMDRNSSQGLQEESAQKSAKDTEAWILAAADLANVKPIPDTKIYPYMLR